MTFRTVFSALALSGAALAGLASSAEGRPHHRYDYCYYHECAGRWHDMNWKQHRRERDRWRLEHPDRTKHQGP